MSTAPPQANDVQDRLATLEYQLGRVHRQNRTLMLCLLLVPLLAALAGAKAATEMIDAKLVSTQKLVIKGPEGKVAATLEGTSGGGALVLHDARERPRIVVGVSDTAGLIILGSDGQKRVELGQTKEHGPRLNLQGKDMPRPFFTTGVAVENGVPFFQLMDEHGKLIRGVGGKSIQR